ncbi:MAG: hypothetical protein AAB578_05860 [Elusimicrobiota bacterium]
MRARFNSAVAGPDSSDLAAEFERRMRAAGMEPEPVKVVSGHPEEAKPKVAAAEPAKPPPASAPPPLPEKKPEAGGLTGKTMIGGVSPAIVYLQNLKMQIEHFEKEIQQLRGDVSGFVQKHDTQYSYLLKRLGDLQGGMHPQASAPPPAREEADRAPRTASPGPPPAARPAAQAKAPAAAPAAPAASQAAKPSPQSVAAAPAPKAAAAMPVVEVLSPMRVPQEAPAPKPVPPGVETTAPIPIQAAAVAAAPSAPAPPPAADESMSLRPPDENAGKKGKAPIWPV